MPAYEQLVEDVLNMWRQLRRTNHAPRNGEITPEQFVLLRHLHQVGPSSIGELAGALGVTQSAATMASQRLEKAGLATRTRDRADERVVRVDLTPAGHERIADWRKQTRAALMPMLEPLSPSERTEFQRLMRKIVAARDDRVVSATLWSILSVAGSVV
jgi:DNA-binding MarR family transcriptional regulator